MLARLALPVLLCGIVLFTTTPAAADTATLNVRISWGHEAAQASAFEIKPVPGAGVEIQSIAPRELESGEAVREGVARTRAGGGDVDALDLVVIHPKEPAGVTQNVHILWTDLIAASDADTARRLGRDPSFRTRPSMLTIQMDAAGTKGFSVSIDQLKTERALWIPSLGVYVTATAGGAGSDQPVAFADHLKTLAQRKGQRILDRVKHEPEATDAQFLARWEDMGSPLFSYPEQRGPGHIVGVTWDSAIRKFGIDRAGGVWNDEGNPDKFRFWLSVGDLARGVAHSWKGQRLTDGLPILIDDVRGGWAAVRAGAVRVSAGRAAVRAPRRHPDGVDAAGDRARAARDRAARAGRDDASPADAAVYRRCDRDVPAGERAAVPRAGAARRAAVGRGR